MARPLADKPLAVSVLVDLERAGGHVRCWERLAEAGRAKSALAAGTISGPSHHPASGPTRRNGAML